VRVLSNFGAVWVVAEPGWSLRRDIGLCRPAAEIGATHGHAESNLLNSNPAHDTRASPKYESDLPGIRLKPSSKCCTVFQEVLHDPSSARNSKAKSRKLSLKGLNGIPRHLEDT